MPRPFAVAGFTAFFTVALLSDCETGVMMYAFLAYIIALVIALLSEAVREGRVIPFSMACGAFSCILLICFNVFVYEPIIQYDGKTAHIAARLCSFPQERYGNVYYQAETITVDGVETNLKLRLTFNQKPDADPYDLVEGRFTFYRPGFTSDEYLESNKAKGNYLAAYSLDGKEKFISVDESDKPFAFKIELLRNEIKDAVYSVMPDERGAVANALLIGDKSGVDGETMREFRLSGLMHIICVSGFHLSLWSNFILLFFRKLGAGIKTSSFLAIIGVLFFMLISGLSSSVLRSGIMMLVFLIGNIFSRKSDSLNSLGFALFALFVFNPMILTDTGLRLSALSTLGIILFNEHFSSKIKDLCLKTEKKRLSSFAVKILLSLCVTAAAVLFIQPVALEMQGNFNFLVLVTNLLVTSVAGIAMVFSAFAAVLGMFIPAQFNIFASVASALIKYILFVADKFSRQLFLTFYIEKDTGYFILSSVLLICAVSAFLIYKQKIKPKFCILMAVVVFLTSVVSSSLLNSFKTRFNVLDVGNGTAVALTYKGRRILFGCGGSLFSAENAIENYLYRNGESLDVLVIPDDSESSSLYSLNLIKSYRPETVQTNALTNEMRLVLSENNTVSMDEILNFDGIVIRNICIDGDYCTFVETPDASALICYNPIKDYYLIPPEFRNVDVLITRGDYPSGAEKAQIDFIAVNAENRRGCLIQEELLSSGVDCAATAECGNIAVTVDNGEVHAYRN